MSLDTSDSQKCPILVDCMNPQIVDTSYLEDQVLQAWFTTIRGPLVTLQGLCDLIKYL